MVLEGEGEDGVYTTPLVEDLCTPPPPSPGNSYCQNRYSLNTQTKWHYLALFRHSNTNIHGPYYYYYYYYYAFYYYYYLLMHSSALAQSYINIYVALSCITQVFVTGSLLNTLKLSYFYFELNCYKTDARAVF